MTFLELALKGVRNFTQFTRIPFQPGLNVVYGGNQSGKSTIWQVLRLQLTGQRQQAAADSDQWGQAALSFRGDDGHTYSLAGYFREHRHKLGRRDGKGHFKRVPASDHGNDPWIPVAEGAPSLWPLCMGGANWLPSQHAITAALNGPGDGSGSALASLNLSHNHSQAPSRIDPLHQHGAAAQQAERLETQLAECYSHRTLLSDRLDAAKRINREMERVTAARNNLSNAANISDEEEGALVGYLDDEAALRETIIGLDQNIIAAEDDLAAFPCTSMSRRPLFHFGWMLAALGGGLYYMFGLYPVVMVCLGVGFTLLFGACAKGFGQGATLRRKAAAITRLKAELDALETPLQERYKTLLDSLEAMGFATPRAAFSARRQLHEISARLEELDDALHKTLDGVELAELEEEMTDLQQRIHTIQEQHQSLQAAGTDAVRREALHHPLEGDPQAVEVASAGPAGLDVSIEPHLQGEPAMREALDRRRDAYCARASELLRRFTVSEFTALETNGDYYPTLLGEHDAGHGSHAPGSGMADLIYLAQYVAMVETLDPKGSFPLVLDEPFMALDTEHRDLVYGTLQELSRGRQVVLLTCQKFMTSPADHLVML